MNCFNLYRPPTIEVGDSSRAQRWLDHVARVYPGDAEHIINWLAHRVQRPHEKINHALVLGGAQGIGKDTLLEPVKRGVGPWNFAEVSPAQAMGRFNTFLRSVILRISEARDLGDTDRYAFYDRMKAYTAAPPDTLRVEQKYMDEYHILNVTGVIITTNHKTAGIYLPADDRRHYVAWSELTKEHFTEEYWNGLWNWYESGGDRDVASYLMELDLEEFNPKAPPPKTEAFWAMVDAGVMPETTEMAAVIDKLGWPDALTLDTIKTKATDQFGLWVAELRNRRIVGHRLEDCGYTRVNNPDAKDRLWAIGGKRQIVYAKAALSTQARIDAARSLAE
jgi:hypothetical protein